MSNEPPVIHTEKSAVPPQVSSVGQETTGRETSQPSSIRKLIDNKLAMLAMLFFVTAALGLPFLWRSKRFSRTEKGVWSVIVSIYTIIILWAFCAVMWWSYSRIRESMQF